MGQLRITWSTDAVDTINKYGKVRRVKFMKRLRRLFAKTSRPAGLVESFKTKDISSAQHIIAKRVHRNILEAVFTDNAGKEMPIMPRKEEIVRMDFNPNLNPFGYTPKKRS